MHLRDSKTYHITFGNLKGLRFPSSFRLGWSPQKDLRKFCSRTFFRLDIVDKFPVAQNQQHQSSTNHRKHKIKTLQQVTLARQCRAGIETTTDDGRS